MKPQFIDEWFCHLILSNSHWKIDKPLKRNWKIANFHPYVSTFLAVFFSQVMTVHRTLACWKKEWIKWKLKISESKYLPNKPYYIVCCQTLHDLHGVNWNLISGGKVFMWKRSRWQTEKQNLLQKKRNSGKYVKKR